MGIKGHNKFVKERVAHTNAFFELSIKRLARRRVAIDAALWMYTNMAIARKKVIKKTNIQAGEPNPIEIRREWCLAAINFIITWLTNGITPVFVFDGVHLDDKADTKAKRADIKVASKAKIKALYAELNGENGHIKDYTVPIVEELRKELLGYTCISSEDYELFKMMIKGIGIPCLNARGDGEQLCSMLCVEGKVGAVFSADTDNLVYGCPLLITDFTFSSSYDEIGMRIPTMNCVRSDLIVSGLGITHEMYVDFCIMCGCDFNTNIPNIAAIKSFALLQQHRSIDNLPRNLDTTCLNYQRCREIFKYTPSEELIIKDEVIVDEKNPLFASQEIYYPAATSTNILDINKNALATARDYLEMAGISGQIERLIAAYNMVPAPIEGPIEGLNIPPAPRYIPPPKKIILNLRPAPAQMTSVPLFPQPTVKGLTLNIIRK